MSDHQVLGAVPIKPFAAAKQRLAAVLDSGLRASISKEMAHRTVASLRSTGAIPVVLASDGEVAHWASSAGVEVIRDMASDLDSAASAAAAEAGRRGLHWLILHGDLPLLNLEVLGRAVNAIGQGRPVIAPSADGGNPLLGSAFPLFPFAYGPGSFQRHLRVVAGADPLVLVDPRLAVDLDGPDDLIALRRMVPWLAEITDTLPHS